MVLAASSLSSSGIQKALVLPIPEGRTGAEAVLLLECLVKDPASPLRAP